MLGAPEQTLHPGIQALVHHQVAAARVGEAVLDLLGGPPAVQPDADAAHAGRPEQRHQPVRRVVGEDRQPVARAQPEAVAQGVAGAEDAVGELAVGDAALALDHAVLVAAQRGVRDLLPQALLAVLEVLERASPHQLLLDLEGGAAGGERGDGLVVGHGA